MYILKKILHCCWSDTKLSEKELENYVEIISNVGNGVAITNYNIYTKEIEVSIAPDTIILVTAPEAEKSDLEDLRKKVMKALSDPTYLIVTHYEIAIQSVKIKKDKECVTVIMADGISESEVNALKEQLTKAEEDNSSIVVVNYEIAFAYHNNLFFKNKELHIQKPTVEKTKALVKGIAKIMLPTKEELSTMPNKKERLKVIKNKILEAFYSIECQDLAVKDIVMNVYDYAQLRMFPKFMKIIPDGAKVRRGYFSELYKARIWVRKDVKEIVCFPENSKDLKKLFPDIVIAKKELGIED